jgi:hypothetical protein
VLPPAIVGGEVAGAESQLGMQLKEFVVADD